jgi:glycosyltransferase involved in cell wall biosynthesis
MISVVIPVYKNAENIPDLLAALGDVHRQLNGELEVVFVVDGSPDQSYALLAQALPGSGLRAQLLLLSRNFGSFSAIRAGLAAARGDRLAVMAADLQEPPELLIEFDRRLAAGGSDVVIGVRKSRQDPFGKRLTSNVFWSLYRRYVQGDIPPGGVDVFACTPRVRDHLIAMQESNSSLVALLFWVGFRREMVPYDRRARRLGRSAWSFRKRVSYLYDSVFSFSDLPIKILFRVGVLGLGISLLAATIILGARLLGEIQVPGYAPIMLLVLFFGGLNSMGLGIIGSYVWRTFENTKKRPNYIVAAQTDFGREASTLSKIEVKVTGRSPEQSGGKI